MNNNAIIAILIFVALISWIMVPDEEVSDPYIISIEYDCRLVSKNPLEYSKEVIEECKTVIEELNASKRTSPNPKT